VTDEVFRPRGPRAWQAIQLLLGAEVTILLVWLWSGIVFGGDPRFDGRQWSEPVRALLEIVPLLTILVALRLGWVERRPAVVVWLVGLTLAGPVLFAASPLTTGLSYDLLGALLRISTWAATPACTAAAAGLVAALRRRPGRGYVLVLFGGVVGFLALALPMNALAIGYLAECPTGCDPLMLRGIGGAAIVVGFIGLVTMTPGFVVGVLVGRRLHDP
jgi:hypothetical protein